jgi:hypothetical protein
MVQPKHSLAFVIGRLAFVVLFSYLVGKAGNPAYLVILIVLGFGEA